MLFSHEFPRLLLVPLALVAAPAAAGAATFEAATGVVVLEGSIQAMGFEEAEPWNAISMFTRRGAELGAEEIQAQVVDGGIEGKRALAVGGTAFIARLDLNLMSSATSLSGRRVEIRYWLRSMGSRVVGRVLWSADGETQLAELPFQLSGRATDDGWQEWTSGPFDFALAGLLAPTSVLFYSNQGGGFGGGATTTASPQGWIDAISVDDLGPAAVSNARCTLSNEATRCGPEGTCMLGRCVDAAVALGPVYQSSGLRADYLARRAFEYTHLEGGRLPGTLAATFRERMSALAAETSAVPYWKGFLTALQLLEDGHASPPLTQMPPQRATGICAHLGLADLLPANSALPMVFETSRSSAIARELRRGDVLVELDGMPVHEWVEAAAHYVTFYGDQRARAVVSAPDILDAAAAVGSVATFARCIPTSTASVQPCTGDQVQRITLDLGEAAQSAWTASAPGWLADSIFCDYRFNRAFAAPDGKAYAFAGSSDLNGIRTIQINGVPAQAEQGGQEWFTAIATAFTGAPAKLLLDQRTGFGGGIDAVDHLAGYLVGREDFDQMYMCPQSIAPVDDNLLSNVRACLASGGQSGSYNASACGDFIVWQLGAGRQSAVARTSSIAVLVGYDVSGNDFVTKLLTYREAGKTRIFGGAPTAGAFGVIWSLPAISNEVSGGSIQVQDTIFRANRSDLNLDFQTGRGVPPDEVVLQKQSDAIKNVDTVVEAARAWLSR